MSQSPEFGKTPAVFLTGTGVEEKHFRFYKGINADLVALPEKGFPEIEKTYSKLRDTVLKKLEYVDGPIVLGGHSQGGVHALNLSLDPELRGRVVNTLLVASPSRGFSEANAPLGAKVVKRLFGNPPAADGLLDTSDFMMALSEMAGNEWPETTRITAMVPAGDLIVPPITQLGIELPRNQEVHEILHGRPHQVKRALAKAAAYGIATENIETHHSRIPSGHLFAGRNFRNIINKSIQEQYAEYELVA